MAKVISNSGLNQHNKDVLIEENSVSDTCCVCLKEANYAVASKMCRQKIHTCGHACKDVEMDILYILCFIPENVIEGKIKSKINLEIQTKRMKMNLLYFKSSYS